MDLKRRGTDSQSNPMKSSINLIAALILSFTILVMGCEEDFNNSSGKLIETPTEILNAPDTLIYDQKNYVLDCFIWRDFMPPLQEQDGSSMMVSVDLVSADSTQISPNLSLEYLWVIHGVETWATLFENEERPNYSFKINAISRDGPKWEVFDSVHVVVRIAANDEIFMLRSLNQVISRTD